MDSKKTVPFQRNQMQKIVDVMGLPTKERWPLLTSMPEYSQLPSLSPPLGGGGGGGHGGHHGHHGYGSHHHHQSHHGRGGNNAAASVSHLEKWYYGTINQQISSTAQANGASSLSVLGAQGYNLLAGLLEYDPEKRLTAANALQHPFFAESPDPINANCFAGVKMEYPHRRVSQDDNDIRTGSLPGTKRSGLPDDSLRPGKRVKEN